MELIELSIAINTAFNKGLTEACGKIIDAPEGTNVYELINNIQKLKKPIDT